MPASQSCDESLSPLKLERLFFGSVNCFEYSSPYLRADEKIRK